MFRNMGYLNKSGLDQNFLMSKKSKLILGLIAAAVGLLGIGPMSIGRPLLDTEVLPPGCRFNNLVLPEDTVVFAARSINRIRGRETGFQIDQSGSQALQIDVVVNSPERPVLLRLYSYEPNIWNVKWTQGTNIVGVMMSGYHQQRVAGLPKKTPWDATAHQDDGLCPRATRTPDTNAIFRKPTDKMFDIVNAMVVMGNALPATPKLVTNEATPPTSFYDPSAPLAGKAGIEDAARRGLLRQAVLGDARAWARALEKRMSPEEVRAFSGQSLAWKHRPPKQDSEPVKGYWVITHGFRFPNGLYGGHSGSFFLPAGVPWPAGDPGHSTVYDFNTMECKGICSEPKEQLRWWKSW